MVTATVNPVRKSNGTPTNPPLTLSLPEIFPNGSSSSSNPAKETFFLLDLLQVVKKVGTALGEFKCNHGADVDERGIKHLEVMMEALEHIHSAGTKQVGKISKVKYLTKAYKLTQTADRKRKAEDPMAKVRNKGAVCELREFVTKCKKARAEVIEKENAPPLPMQFYKEPRQSNRGTNPIPTTESLQQINALQR